MVAAAIRGVPAADLTRGRRRRRFVNNSGNYIYIYIVGIRLRHTYIIFTMRIYIYTNKIVWKKKKNLANRKYHDHTSNKQSNVSGVFVYRRRVVAYGSAAQRRGGRGEGRRGALQWPIGWDGFFEVCRWRRRRRVKTKRVEIVRSAVPGIRLYRYATRLHAHTLAITRHRCRSCMSLFKQFVEKKFKKKTARSKTGLG